MTKLRLRSASRASAKKSREPDVKLDDRASSTERLSILIVSGPNLDRLGVRQPEIYGTQTLGDISQACAERGAALNADVTSVQTSQEGDIVDILNTAADDGNHAIILNAGGYTHTSVAILDAILGSPLPVIEVHLSNPEAREEFRHRSVIARGCVGKVSGFGALSYVLAVEAAVRHVRAREGSSR